MANTKEWDNVIDFGLSFIFDGKSYRLFMEYSTQEYKIGSMACEYCRLRPTEIKSLLLGLEGLDKETTPDTFTDAFIMLYKLLPEYYPPIIATMIATEFYTISIEWFEAVRTDRVEEFLEPFYDTEETIKRYILSDTGCDEFGGDTVLQLLLTCYSAFACACTAAKGLFTRVMSFDDQEDGVRERNMDAWLSMYADHMKFQHIDYRIILTEQGFESLYTVRSSISLILFELAQVINIGANIVKCRNCDNYFVPVGRADSVYCSYPTGDNPDKTCKDVGARITRANKERSDIATKEYRKVYMRYKMKLSRGKKKPSDERKFRRLTTDVKEWRRKMKEGQVTTEEFMEWLKSF